jgi:hypothetical protein
VPGQVDKSAPAFYSFQINTCFLNLDKPAHEVSAYFVHEMHHASQHHEHNSPKAWEVSNRDKWVRMMVEEEVIGTAKGFEHKRRIENQGVAPKDDKPSGMANYRRTFNYWRDQVKKEGGTDFEAGQKGREMGTARVRLMIKDPHQGRQTAELGPPGGVGESYEGWYTREWNDEQKKHAKTPP